MWYITLPIKEYKIPKNPENLLKMLTWSMSINLIMPHIPHV